jgi:hypothetical protein
MPSVKPARTVGRAREHCTVTEPRAITEMRIAIWPNHSETRPAAFAGARRNQDSGIRISRPGARCNQGFGQGP